MTVKIREIDFHSLPEAEQRKLRSLFQVLEEHKKSDNVSLVGSVCAAIDGTRAALKDNDTLEHPRLEIAQGINELYISCKDFCKLYEHLAQQDAARGMTQ